MDLFQAKISVFSLFIDFISKKIDQFTYDYVKLYIR